RFERRPAILTAPRGRQDRRKSCAEQNCLPEGEGQENAPSRSETQRCACITFLTFNNPFGLPVFSLTGLAHSSTLLVVRLRHEPTVHERSIGADAKPEPLTPAEWKVMKIVWRRKQCAARDVYEEAGRLFGWAPTTAKTVLRRLVEKGHLTAEQIGNS